jgi:hypothetical protein
MRVHYGLLGGAMLGALGACSDTPESSLVGGGNAGGADSGNPGGTGGSGSSTASGSGGFIDLGGGECGPQTCAELGWACGYTVDVCGTVIDCANEGLTCAAGEICTGGINGPTQCVAGGGEACDTCSAIPDCSAAPEPTRLTGRVISPGRNDGDTGNQVGVPNAIVYILRNNVVADLPAMASGIPSGGTSCDRCEDQDLGPVLAGAVTDAAGNYSIEGDIPVGVEFLLVVKAGKFRRAVAQTLQPAAACQTTTLPDALPANPTRLPRSMDDGLAVNIPRVAISTGQIDAMECVLEKMGIDHGEFANSGAPRIHLYRGGETVDAQAGASIDGSTSYDAELYGTIGRMEEYDMVVADCEGQTWDGDEENFVQRNAFGANVREYVNRGGRLFASHLSMSWLHENGTTEYTAADPIATGLGLAGTWDTAFTADGNLDTSGTGVVAVGRPKATPSIQSFADWMVNEGVTTAANNYEFALTDPRSLATALGDATEEFVVRDGGNDRVQQFSFSTPYGAPVEAACGRVAYSGFHVANTGGSSTPFVNATFPDHCIGDLTNQEKVLLYMLFDLGACVGEDPIPPPCVPISCGAAGTRCGFTPDGCGNVLDCGACRPPA